MSNRLKIVENDPWLEPVEADVLKRYLRFNERLDQITKDFGGLNEFASAYEYFGIHFDEQRKGWVYREWAPRAEALFLFGDFNNWERFTHPMRKDPFGIWELFLPYSEYKNSFVHGSKIKVEVIGENGMHARIPAYIQRVIQNPETKNYDGQLWFPEQYNWESDEFISKPNEPLLIYECHIGMAQEMEGVGSYREFREIILPKIKKAGYNSIQLMAIQEHPYYGSFGYHVSNFFAASSRFGSPEDLKDLIKAAHKMGLAVIMDIVHSHSVKNINEGINEWDGSEDLYFHAGKRGKHPQWDSCIFDYGKTEVQRFLLSNIKYWMKEFHFDGFRFDGVGSMMYFHFGLESISRPEQYFSEGVEWDAITYLQLANKLAHTINPSAITIAEDVTGMPGSTSKIDHGGLGFDYRLGMAIPDYWIKLLMDQKDEQWDIWDMWDTMNKRTAGTQTIAYAESHDQALVGDKTIAFRLMGEKMYSHMSKLTKNHLIDRGIALHKMIRLFTISLAGQAYLNFMGNEFGHPEWIDFPREGNHWSYLHARRQWSLSENKLLKYHQLMDFDRAMISLMKKQPVLQTEFGYRLQMDEENQLIVYKKGNLIFIFNFSPENALADYEIKVPEQGAYKVLLNTDDKEFGGIGRVNTQMKYNTYRADETGHFLKIYIPNRSAMVMLNTKLKI
ncbi:MAG: alpha amylase C-terminal domain-containing protein [Bacteroidales bacterium]|nr:alpha amylase C-terminal domain-containing protein [Bacteroidales bacterium]